MLLIGSRAIRYHFPEFRPPVDWDLVGTTREILHLDELLERHRPRRRTPLEQQDKAHFLHDGRLVEVANADRSAYWGRVYHTFEAAPVVDGGRLGELRLAPAAFLLLTKQCGLVYDIVHWHKNLEDVYFLRDRIPEMPESIAALWPDAVADSARMFERGHRRAQRKATGCFPGPVGPRDVDLHRLLHRTLALGASPWVDHAGAWCGFPDATPNERLLAMTGLFAEEAMVVAAERLLADRSISGGGRRGPEEHLRASLRALIVGGLPVGWRYFGVNHYREIRAAVPQRWADRLAELPAEALPGSPRPCSTKDAPTCLAGTRAGARPSRSRPPIVHAASVRSGR